jgi:hypothetical protein
VEWFEVTELVELSFEKIDGGRVVDKGKSVMPRCQAERILWLAGRGQWPDYHFRYEPLMERPMVFLTAVKAFFAGVAKAKAIAFVLSHLEIFVALILAIVMLAILAFTPRWERPVIVVLPVALFFVGMYVQKKYFTKTPAK